MASSSFSPASTVFQSDLTDVSRPFTPKTLHHAPPPAHLTCYLSPQVNTSQCSSSSPTRNVLKISPCSQVSSYQRTTTKDLPAHYVQLANNSPRITYLPTLTKLHPHTQVLHPLIFTEAGTQTDINISNGVCCVCV